MDLAELMDDVAEKIQEESLRRHPVPKDIDEMLLIDKVLARIPEKPEEFAETLSRWNRRSHSDWEHFR